MRNVSIDRIMTVEPVTIGPDESIADARRLMRSKGIHHLPVVQSGKLVGIVSAADMLDRLLVEEDAVLLASITVGGLMQERPQVLALGATLRDAANALRTGAFHSLPVVAPDRTLVGIVTSSDLVQYLLRQIPVGDGSLPGHEGAAAGRREGLPALEIIERAAARGELPDDAAQAFRWLTQRHRDLSAVVEAAEHYIRSGLADHEHSVLIKRLAAIRDRDIQLNL